MEGSERDREIERWKSQIKIGRDRKRVVVLTLINEQPVHPGQD